ncbi:MAG: ribosomal protein [Fibrobacteria bacterium]|jgi:four helix bundle protein|nr:ribosomal protein [Fibrobacteria bacterium]
MSKKSYRELHVWRESVSLIPDIYACLQDFPAYERFALTDQIRRAAVSVPANIAEGQARYYKREFFHHLCIARGSLAELQTLLIIAEQVGYLSQEKMEILDQGLQGVARPLNGLIESVREGVRAERSARNAI